MFFSHRNKLQWRVNISVNLSSVKLLLLLWPILWKKACRQTSSSGLLGFQEEINSFISNVMYPLHVIKFSNHRTVDNRAKLFEPSRLVGDSVFNVSWIKRPWSEPHLIFSWLNLVFRNFPVENKNHSPHIFQFLNQQIKFRGGWTEWAWRLRVFRAN